MEISSDSLITATLFGKMLMGLFIVLALMGLLVLVLKYLHNHKASFLGTRSDLTLKSTLSLGGKHRVCVVTWNDQPYLIGLTPTGGFLIDKGPTPPSKPKL